MAKTYLITGASGWLGCTIVETLCQNNVDRVTNLKLFDLKISEEAKSRIESAAKEAQIKIDWIIGDITNFKTLYHASANVDVVIHTAAVVDHLGEVEDDILWKVNVEGTANVIKVCLKSNIQYCVYTSSTSVVGPNANGDPFHMGDESTPYPIKHASTYDKTKREAEEKILAANGKSLANGKKFCTCALRPGGIYGRGDSFILQMFKSFGTTKVLLSPSESHIAHTRVNVNNVAWAHVLAAKKIQEPKNQVCGNAYFLGDDTPNLPYMRLNAIFLEDYGFKISREPFLPYWILYIIGFLCVILRVICSKFNYHIKTPLTPATLRISTTPFTFSHKKFADNCGYKPLLSWEESLDQTKAYIRAWVKQNS